MGNVMCNTVVVLPAVYAQMLGQLFGPTEILSGDMLGPQTFEGLRERTEYVAQL